MGRSWRPDWARRLQRAARILSDRHLDGLVVSNPQNVRYLTGFTGSSGWVFVTPASSHFLTDGRYTNFVRKSMVADQMSRLDLEVVSAGYDEALAAIVLGQSARRVGFEAGTVTVAGLREWQRLTPSVEWEATDDVVEGLRLIKDEIEIACFRSGAERLGDVVADLRQLVRADRTERQVAHAIDEALREAGFERPAFETIVASGPNSAYPHARPTDRRLADGDAVVLDFGGVFDGYCVDLTRMAAVGHVDARVRSLFEAVHEAQRAALETVRAGVTSASVDRAARSQLENRGLGPAFSHGTGHGLGLDVHEAPRISRAESGHVTTLAPGMVFTVEPGAYVDGLGGVRLEDDVLVTADGCEVLTTYPRDLLVV